MSITSINVGERAHIGLRPVTPGRPERWCIRSPLTICARCGKTRPALDMGSVNDTPYCHGAWDPSPTCYETAFLDAFDDADGGDLPVLGGRHGHGSARKKPRPDDLTGTPRYEYR